MSGLMIISRALSLGTDAEIALTISRPSYEKSIVSILVQGILLDVIFFKLSLI